MDPFDPAVQHFIPQETPFECEYGNSPPLIESNNTALFVNPLAWNEFYNSSESINCCWRSFWRPKDNDNSVVLVLLIIYSYTRFYNSHDFNFNNKFFDKFKFLLAKVPLLKYRSLNYCEKVLFMN